MSAGVLYARENERESKKEVERESKKELRVQACFMLARMRTPSSLVRERERERKRKGDKEGGRERGGRERDVEYVQNCYFYF